MEAINQTEKIHIADVTCIATWKKEHKQYSTTTSIYIGKIKIAGYFYDGMRSKDDPKCYKVTSTIPTIKNDIGNFATEEECRKVCLQVVKVFCNQLTDNT